MAAVCPLCCPLSCRTVVRAAVMALSALELTFGWAGFVLARMPAALPAPHAAARSAAAPADVVGGDEDEDEEGDEGAESEVSCRLSCLAACPFSDVPVLGCVLRLPRRAIQAAVSMFVSTSDAASKQRAWLVSLGASWAVIRSVSRSGERPATQHCVPDPPHSTSRLLPSGRGARPQEAASLQQRGAQQRRAAQQHRRRRAQAGRLPEGVPVSGCGHLCLAIPH